MAERWILRCTHAQVAEGIPYEQDFKREDDARHRAKFLAESTVKGICHEPHLVIKQEWQAGRWIDCCDDLTSEDRTGTMEP